MNRVPDEGIEDAGTLLRRVAQLHPDREAFVHGDRRMTFAEWDRAADAVAGDFQRRGVVKGDVVCLLMPSCVEYAIAYQAAMRLGAITSGINPRLGPNEKASILERTRPKVTIQSEHEVQQAIEQGGTPATFPNVEATDPCAIVWTSGTTGVPKGAVFDHGCLRAMANGAGALSAPGDRRLSPLPFAHVAYMTRMWDELVHVITTVVMPTPWNAADHLRLIEAERITVGQGVPTQWELVLRNAGTADTSSLRIVSTGAARVPAELVEALRARFDVPVVVRYTSTEASISTGTQLDDPDDVVANTVGRPSAEVELTIVDGEVCLRSRAAMRRYWEDPERTAEVIDADGWVHTGDLGRLDDDGNLILLGRKVEMYTRGGYNVYPAEVEAALGEHPAVDRVAVIGVPDPVLGSVGLAAIVPNGSAPDLDEIKAWCRERIADYKAPDRLVVLDDLPLTSMLKVDKRALAELVHR